MAKSLKRTLVALILLFVSMQFAWCQINDNSIRLEVLKLNHIGIDYKFNNKKDKSVTSLRYLGKAKTTQGLVYKILTSIWICGQSTRATSRILIFTGNNNYYGQYYVTTTYDLPDELRGNNLIFLNKNKAMDGCDLKLVTKIDLSNDLPKEFFLRCKGNTGDF